MAAAKLAILSALGTKFAPSHNSPRLQHHNLSSPTKRNHFSRMSARLGGEEGDAKKEGKKKFITREEEPDQYWQTAGERAGEAAGERAGENPMKTPLPYIIIFGMSTPFVILAIAFANGWIKVPVK